MCSLAGVATKGVKEVRIVENEHCQVYHSMIGSQGKNSRENN